MIGFHLYSFIVAASTGKADFISESVDMMHGAFLGSTKSSLSQSFGSPVENSLN